MKSPFVSPRFLVIRDFATGAVLETLPVARIPFLTAVAFELRWLVAAPLRALRAVFESRVSR